MLEFTFVLLKTQANIILTYIMYVDKQFKKLIWVETALMLIEFRHPYPNITCLHTSQMKLISLNNGS